MLKDIMENKLAAAKWAAVPYKQAVLACKTGTEFTARFKNAPEWVLNRIEACLANLGHLNWATDQVQDPFNWVGKARAQNAAEKAASEFLSEHPYCGVGFNRLVEAALRGPILTGDGPTVENWDFADKHKGPYTDSAWTSSREAAPGVWYEARHGVNSGTRRWTIIEV